MTNKTLFISFQIVCFLFFSSFFAQKNTIFTKKIPKEVYTESISYLEKAKQNLLNETYSRALKNAYNISGFDYKQNTFVIDRIKAIAHSKLHRADSAIFFAEKIMNSIKNQPLNFEMVDIYGVLAWNYRKYNKIEDAFKYSNLTVQAINASIKEEKEKVKLMRAYHLAGIVSAYYAKERENKLKRTLIFISVLSILILSFILIFSLKRRKKLRLKLEVFKNELEDLKEADQIKKEKTYSIDELTTKRILKGLKKVENSSIFIDQEFSLSVLAKILNTNTSYLSKIINSHKKATFKQYLIELRVDYLLKQLDENTIMRKYSIEALASTIGYKNASSFTRIFKSYTGKSPSLFLKEKYSN